MAMSSRGGCRLSIAAASVLAHQAFCSGEEQFAQPVKMLHPSTTGVCSVHYDIECTRRFLVESGTTVTLLKSFDIANFQWQCIGIRKG